MRVNSVPYKQCILIWKHTWIAFKRVIAVCDF